MATISDKVGGGYRLFGGLVLPNPHEFLSPHELKHLQRLEPFIRDLENRQQDTEKSNWNCQEAFDTAVAAKVQLWQQHGVTRRQDYTVGPDGLLEATVACHLHCPSFSVKNPISRIGADDTNVSIAQVLLAGFTPDKCLLYDHLFRREATDGLRYYPPNILDVHERFTWDLRDNMRAIVDVCWGKCVKERMKAKLCLSQLPLWGKYKGVDLWLEWKNHQDLSKSYLARFVLFVIHPEAMVYANKSTQGKLQDLHLSVAALLGNITIDPHFYEANHRRGTYGRLTKVDWVRQKRLNEEARAHVFSCKTVPTTKALIYQSQAGDLATVPIPLLCIKESMGNDVEDNKFDEPASEDKPSVAESELSSSRREQVHSTSVVEILPEVNETVKGPQGFRCLISSLVNTCMEEPLDESEEPFDVVRAIEYALELLSSMESDEYSIFGDPNWEDIPVQLRSWLQKQEGLRIDKCPISSAGDLLRVQQLLCRKTLGFESFESVSIMKVFIDVAVRYYKQINPKDQSSKIKEHTIPGKDPVPRKCGACGTRVLDDAFPRFKKLDPSTYVLRALKGGCGLKGCEPQGAPTSVMGVPVDGSVKYCRADNNLLKRPPRTAQWGDVLIHSKEAALRHGLPTVVECVCRNCETHTNTDKAPRWTIEPISRYVPSRPRCPICNRGSSNRRPVDQSIKYLDVAAITKTWKMIQDKGYLIENVLADTQTYFPAATGPKGQIEAQQRTKKRRRRSPP